MADLARLEDAFKQAHAAGDTEGAQRLADAIRAQRATASQPQAPAQEKRGLGEFLGETAMDFARGANDIVAGINTAAIDLVQLPVALYNAGVQSVGAGGLTVKSNLKDIPFIERATARQVQEEDQTTGQNMLRTAAEWGAGGLVAKGSKVPDIVSGAGAAVGEQIGGDTGEMIGGLAGLISGKPRAPKSEGATKLDRTTKDFILANAHNPQRALANIKSGLANGEVGNLAELSRDQGLFNVVKAADIQGSEFSGKLGELAKARNEQIIDESSGMFGGGEATDATRIAATRQQQLQSGASQRNRQQLEQETQQLQADEQFAPIAPQAAERLNEARAAEEAALGRVATDVKPSEASTRLSETYSAEEAAFKQEFVDPAWQKFSEGNNLSGKDFNNVVKKELDSLNETEANMLLQKFGGEINLLRGLGDEVKPDEVHAIISQMKAINRNARRNNEYDNANRLLDKTINSMEEGLRQLGNKGAYDEATRLSSEQFKRFQPTRVGEARGLQEDSTLGARLLGKDEFGYEVGRLINNSGSPAIRAEAQQYLRSIASREGIDENFMQNYDELLDAFPELKADLSRAKAAQDELAGASTGLDTALAADEKSATALTKAVEKAKTDAGVRSTGLNKSITNLELSKFRQNPSQFIDGAMKGGVQDLGKLNRQLSRTEGGAQALRSAVRDRYVANITDKGGTVTPTKVAEFNANKRNLVESGVLSREEAIEIEGILERANVSGMSKTAGFRKTAEADEIMVDIVSSGAAIAALQLLPASNQLMLGNTVRRVFRGLLGSSKGNATSQQTKVLAALDRMILNPEEFLKGVAANRVVTEQQLIDYVITYANSVSQSLSEDAPNE